MIALIDYGSGFCLTFHVFLYHLFPTLIINHTVAGENIWQAFHFHILLSFSSFYFLTSIFNVVFLNYFKNICRKRRNETESASTKHWQFLTIFNVCCWCLFHSCYYVLDENQTLFFINNTGRIDFLDQELSFLFYIRLGHNILCLKINENIVLLQFTDI